MGGRSYVGLLILHNVTCEPAWHEDVFILHVLHTHTHTEAITSFSTPTKCEAVIYERSDCEGAIGRMQRRNIWEANAGGHSRRVNLAGGRATVGK